MSLEDRLKAAEPIDPGLAINNLQPPLRDILADVGPQLYGLARVTRRWVEAKTFNAETESERVRLREKANDVFAAYVEKELLDKESESSEETVGFALKDAIHEHLTYRGIMQRRLHEETERKVEKLGATNPTRYFRVEVTDLSGDLDPSQTTPLVIDYSLPFVRAAIEQSVNHGHHVDPNEDVHTLSHIIEAEHDVKPCHMEIPDADDFPLEDQAMFALDILFSSPHTYQGESHESVLDSILGWAKTNYGSDYRQSSIVQKIKNGDIRLQTHNVTQYGEDSPISSISSRLKRQEGWKAWYKLFKGDIPTDSVGLQIVTNDQKTSYSVLAGLKLNSNSCADDTWREDAPTLQTLEQLYRTRLDEAGITSQTPTQDVQKYLYEGAIPYQENNSDIKRGMAITTAIRDFSKYGESYQNRLQEDMREYFIQELAPWDTTATMDGRSVLSGLRATLETTVPQPKPWEAIHRDGVSNTYTPAVAEVQILTKEEKSVFEHGILPYMVRAVGTESDRIEMQHVIDSLGPRRNYPVSHHLYADKKDSDRREKAYKLGWKKAIDALQEVYWDIDQSSFFRV